MIVFFDAVIRTILAGISSYILLVALLRVSGKRTLPKMNAFDFVVTVALGSTLATILVSKNLPSAPVVQVWRRWSACSMSSPGCR